MECNSFSSNRVKFTIWLITHNNNKGYNGYGLKLIPCFINLWVHDHSCRAQSIKNKLEVERGSSVQFIVINNQVAIKQLHNHLTVVLLYGVWFASETYYCTYYHHGFPCFNSRREKFAATNVTN